MAGIPASQLRASLKQMHSILSCRRMFNGRSDYIVIKQTNLSGDTPSVDVTVVLDQQRTQITFEMPANHFMGTMRPRLKLLDVPFRPNLAVP